MTMRFGTILLLLALAFTVPAAADVLDGHECFSNDNQRRITGCSALLDEPGLDPATRSSALAMRALALSLLGRYPEAITDYDLAIELQPNFAVALNNRAWAYFRSGQSRPAWPDVQKSLRLDPLSPHAYDTRAHLHQMDGDAGAAYRDYSRAMQLGGAEMVRLYQCGLQAHGLYSGPVNGMRTPMLDDGLRVCVKTTGCDPLPADEECRAATS